MRAAPGLVSALLLTAAAVGTTAACGDVVAERIDVNAAGENEASQLVLCSGWTTAGLLFRPTDGYTNLRDNVGTVPWRTAQIGSTVYKAMAAPLITNNAVLQLTSPSPSCAKLLGVYDDFAERGTITIDGSSSGISIVPHPTSGSFTMYFTLERHVSASTNHTLVVTLPAAPRTPPRTLPTTFSMRLDADLTNPFTFLNHVYSEARCTTCHAMVDRPHVESIHYSMLQGVSGVSPGDVRGCGACHYIMTNLYGVPLDDDFNQWRAPELEKNINWGPLSPLTRCQRTITRFEEAGMSPYNGITDHFFNDKRVRWAVEDGNAHDEHAECLNGGNVCTSCPPDPPGRQECNRAWPYSFDKLANMAADWAFYALTNADACGNIRTDQYTLNPSYGF